MDWLQNLMESENRSLHNYLRSPDLKGGGFPTPLLLIEIDYTCHGRHPCTRASTGGVSGI